MEDNLDAHKVKSMLEACEKGSLHMIKSLLEENSLYASQQDLETGRSPLMAAAFVGNAALCQRLLDLGAPWNAIDRQGYCAGNYATDAGHWDVVNILVEHGVRAEMILGAVERTNRQPVDSITVKTDVDGPVDQQPSTKLDYLRQRLQYTPDGQSLLDNDKDAVMMEWERPLMKAHAQVLMGDGNPRAKSVLNVGFGMGIIDGYLQEYEPAQHYIIEAHPDVYKKIITDGWDKKPNVCVCFGKWQDVVPQLIAKGVQFDSIFYDTYAEHCLDMEDFHRFLPSLLKMPSGIYGFFNGLAPDNIFFHGVVCEVVKRQLRQIGLDSEFLSCEIQVEDKVWEGIRRQYWHGRDTYYLPKCTWNPSFLGSDAPVGLATACPRGRDDEGSSTIDDKRRRMDED